MEILPLPSSNEPITNVVRYLSQPPVIVQKAMAGQARAPGRARSTAVWASNQPLNPRMCPPWWPGRHTTKIPRHSAQYSPDAETRTTHRPTSHGPLPLLFVSDLRRPRTMISDTAVARSARNCAKKRRSHVFFLCDVLKSRGGVKLRARASIKCLVWLPVPPMRACCVPARARDSGLALGAKLLPGAPNPDKHFQWDWRVPSSLRTVGHAPGAWAWPHPAHKPKRVCRARSAPSPHSTKPPSSQVQVEPTSNLRSLT